MGFGQYSETAGTGRAYDNVKADGRVRRVFDSPERVAHLWAAQAQDSARYRDNFYFNGRRIYSYGSHFLAGEIRPDGVALINGDSYSVTTSRHMGAVRYAVNHKTRFTVPDLTGFARILDNFERYKRTVASERREGADFENPDSYAARAKLALESAKREARAWIVRHADSLEAEAGAYLVRLFGWPAATFAKLRQEAERIAAKEKAERQAKEKAAALADAKRFGDMTPEQFALAIPDSSGRDICQASPYNFRKRLARAHKASKAAGYTKRTRTLWDRLAALRAEERGEEPAARIKPDSAAIAAERERRRLEAERKLEEARQAWRSGERTAYYGRLSDPEGGALLRIKGDPANPEEAELETSHGAAVPLSHAIRAFRFVKLIRERGEGWQRNGRLVRVGHYTVDAIEPDGSFRAGCHRINWQEVERVAKLAGVFDCPPSEEAAEPSGH